MVKEVGSTPLLATSPSFHKTGSNSSNRDGRASHSGQAPYKPRTSQQWGPAAPGASPALSQSGSLRRNQRHSARHSRRSQMGEGGGAAQQTLRVLDEDGHDRTPKPLMSLRPSALRGPGPGEEQQSPSSEMSDFFLDRMSSAAFSQAGGTWYSESNSGTHTPKSEAADDDYEMQRERAKAAAAAAAADEAAELALQEALEREAAREQGPACLSPREAPQLSVVDLERSHPITLTETGTDFLLVMPCVTIAGDSEEAKVVEAANKRYTQLLAQRAATDRYTDQEVQTLNPLKKAREVQSSILATSSTGCQAAAWDIADSHTALEDGAAAADASGAAAGKHGANIPSVSQLAGAVAHGNGYGVPTGSGGLGSVLGHSASMMRPGSRAQFSSSGTLTRQESMRSSVGQSHGARVTGMTGLPSWVARSSGGPTVPGMLEGAGPSINPNLPDGPAALEALPPPDLLAGLAGLQEALTVVDAAVCQNIYLPKLLQYRNIHPHNPRQLLATAPAAAGGDGLSHAPSLGPSRALSRVQSRAQSETGSLGQESVAKVGAQSPAHPGSSLSGLTHTGRFSLAGTANGTAAAAGPGPAPGLLSAPSMAESHWPEELLQDLADLGPDGVPRLEPLWDWVCPATEGHQVACMAWNKAAPDLLAVGYGTLSFSKTAAGGASSLTPGDVAAGKEEDSTAGLVAFWSLKNPKYPLWMFETRSGVTAIDFARHQPNILAVGLYDGSVAVYDVKARQTSPSMESDAATGRHSDPVWKVKWIDRGAERDEPLVSISTDGRITQWSIAKGLEFADLMKLKRVPRKNTGMPGSAAAVAASVSGTPTPGSTAASNKAAAAAAAKGRVGGEGDAFISRLTSGMSFDFSARDERIYIAGTEDGWIHRCSTSYAEQYLESYSGHMGPVYSLQWSPFKRDMFVSASGDWTLRLWQEGRTAALLTFQSGSHEVHDVQWCPTNSTVFGSVTSGGRLEIWDFDLSTVKPVATQKTGQKLSCLLFATNSPVVVCGSETGQVSLFRLYNVDREYDTAEEQLSRLEEVIRANVMKAQPGARV